MLVEGASVRSVERITGVHRDTIVRLLGRAGATCERLMNDKVTNLKCQDVEADELWGYVGKKQKHVRPWENHRELGDQYVFVAMDAQTKLVCSYLVGKRNLTNSIRFMRDLRSRMGGKITLTSDGFTPYLTAVERAFGSDVNYAQLVKIYVETGHSGRYSPGEFVEARSYQITGKSERISTSIIERQNLTVRMQMRRFTRLTNGFSKKLASMKAAVALHFAHYNFMRIHSTIKVTPGMQAGLTDHIWTWGELLGAN